MKISTTNAVDRIPYESWINSQLSVAKFCGCAKINGEMYEFDYSNCKTEVNDKGETMYFPDLVKLNSDKSIK